MNLLKNKITKEHVFVRFAKNEGLTQAVDKFGSFEHTSMLFYKKVTSRSFLVFNIYREESKKQKFVADFWMVAAENENEFLKKKISEDHLVDVRLGFDLTRDLELYKSCSNLNEK